MRLSFPVALILALLATLFVICVRFNSGREDHQRDAELEAASRTSAFLGDWAVASKVGAGVPGSLPSRIRRIRDGAEMALIPRGIFMMGSVVGDRDANDDEQPRHEVRLTEDYYLDVNEVTNQQFEAFVKATGYRTTAEESGSGLALRSDGVGWDLRRGAYWRNSFSAEERRSDWHRLPVILVSFNDAIAFARWVGASLPSEAQFERAIRCGGSGLLFPWGDASTPPQDFGNYLGSEMRLAFPRLNLNVVNGVGDDFPMLAPVQSFRPNEYGVCDLSGNVWEWCSDWYDDRYYELGMSVDPTGPAVGKTRVVRGGAWNSGMAAIRSSCRASQLPNESCDFVGLRLAKRVEESSKNR